MSTFISSKKLMGLLIAAACASVPAVRAMQAAPAATPSNNMPAASTLSKTDASAVTDMAMANMAEVELGKLAQSKGESAEVKSFGQQMIDDHSKALDEVKAVASKKGITLPAELDSKHKAEADKLGKLSGAAFDKAYMAKAGLADHKAVHAKLEKVSKSAKDEDVKALAAKMLPTVAQHLEHAQKMPKMK